MEISVSKSELSKAIFITQSIVEKRATMPILANILLSADKGKLKISASDLEITAVANIPANVAKPGSTTVNSKIFSDIVKELPEGDVTLKISAGERIDITAGKSKYKVIGVSSDEYPNLPGIGFEIKSRINAKAFSDMISKTIYSVSQDETRFNLNGVCFEIESDGKKSKTLKMVSTDGHRLALINRPVENFSFKDRVIVPKKGLQEIKKVIESEAGEEIGIDINDGFLIIENRDCKISMRLIDAEYPDYNQVIPAKKGELAISNSDELSRALRRVAIMVTDKGKCVRMDFSKDNVRITSSSPELGDASEDLAISYKGKDIGIGFNARFIIDFLASVGESKNVVLELNGELGPAKLYAEGDDSYFGIVMPMRL